MQELAEVTHAYEQARLGMQERDFLIVAHNRSEAAILEQSAALTGKLHQADQKIKELHERCFSACCQNFPLPPLPPKQRCSCKAMIMWLELGVVLLATVESGCHGLMAGAVSQSSTLSLSKAETCPEVVFGGCGRS